MKKRSLCLLLAMLTLVSLSACGQQKTTPVAETLQVNVAPEQTIYSHMSAQQVGMTGTVVYSDGSSADVSEKLKISGELTPGAAELTVRATVDGNQLQTTVNVEVIDSPFRWETVPEAFTESCAQQGRVEHIRYDSFVYTENGEAGEAGVNEAYVYLPYGYDETKSYNILYLMHGGGENAGYWFCRGSYTDGGWSESELPNFTTTLLDNAISSGFCEPLIVVTPCIYTGDDGARTENSTGLNGVSSFRYEFRNDLVPAIESAYASYAGGDVSLESLIATRSHRGYAGLSMGSMTGFSSILTGCTDLVAYVGNYSGCWADVEAISAALTTDYADYPILFWYNGEGTKDMAHDEHLEGYAKMLDLCGEKFREGVDPLVDNAIMVDKGGHVHNYANWIVDLYNTLACFFRK